MEGLTTTKSPFIEKAQHEGKRFIRQPYELYSDENHTAWANLYSRIQPRWKRYANPKFLEGVAKLNIDPDKVPRIEDINNFLKPLTGFSAKPVSGYIPAYLFFDCLRNREFPTTITVRDISKLDYLPEPDMFHDVAGHVPMHTDTEFADTLVRFGECALSAALMIQELKDRELQVQRAKSVIKAMARFFWFTIEFGLIRSGKELRAYGSGLLSSYGELAYSLDSPEVQRYPIQLEWAVNQYFEIDKYQPLLFIVDSFDHLFSLVGELEKWVKDGKVSNVSPGEPFVSDSDVESFLSAKL
ncbi:MAG: phenylalanine 4-monooxygenase [Ignavibacteria bacterium]|nr:phenylalanine 4-monooxygenase [Ignavibacteria bacterium]